MSGGERPVVCFPFAGGIAGGSHVSAVKLIQSLDPAKVAPLVLLHHDQGDVRDLLRHEGVRYEKAPASHHFGAAPGARGPATLLTFARAAAAQAGMARFLRERRVRVLHSNEGAMHASWAAPTRLAGTKLLWHHRSSPEARGLRYLAPRLADHVISVSRFAASATPALRRSSRLTVVYSPFDTTEAPVDRRTARAMLVRELGIAPETHIIGYFGNFVARKRPILFVDALASAARAAPELPMIGVMFGSTIDPGLDRRTIERAGEHGIADRIRLMGFRYPSRNWLAACDLLLVTAVGEPFGRTLIEAMLLGTPVIAVDAGGNPEAIRDGETGLLARADDEDSIAGALITALRDPDRMRAIAAHAMQDARERFGRERHRDQIMAIYEQLLSA